MRLRALLTLVCFGVFSSEVHAEKFDWDAFDEATTTSACSTLQTQCAEYCRTEATWLAAENLAKALDGDRRRQTDSREFKAECLSDCENSSGECTERIAESEREKEQARQNAELDARLEGKYAQVQSTSPAVAVSCEGNGTPITIKAWPKSGVCEVRGLPSWCDETAGVISISFYDLRYKLSRISGTLTWWNKEDGTTEEARCSKATAENYKF